MLVPRTGSNSESYDKAYARLQDDILLSSCITQTERDEQGVRLVVKGPDGIETLVKAKQLLVTAAPSMKNLASLDLDDQEAAIFSSGTPRPLYVGLVRTSAIPRDFSVYFVSAAAVFDNYLDLYQDLDTDFKIESTRPEDSQLFRVLLKTTSRLSADDAKAYITSHIRKLHSTDTFDGANTDTDLEFVALTDHDSICGDGL